MADVVQPRDGIRDAIHTRKRIKLDNAFETVFNGSINSSHRQIKAQRRSAINAPVWLHNLDRTQVLGEGVERTHYSELPAYGHTGCVNALAWSDDGALLASGSDDFRICLWKMGQDPSAHDPVNDVEGFYPSLGIGLSSIIHTGHTRNIFSVKWLPYSSNSRLVSCAGDARVKVFDLSRTSTTTTVRHNGKEWNEFSSGSALLREFRCHTDRVKRISLEDSPDCFLTVSEDSTVRQFDLREPHVCQVPTRTTCPTPLANYRPFNIQLYTLSVSKLRPELFVCAGTSNFAYLHDRRMGRSMQAEWGVPLHSGVTSQCVRRFALSDPETASAQDTRHITSVKLSELNGRDLAVSYSDGPVALFDIFDDAVPPRQESASPSANKRKRSQTSIEDDSRPSKFEKPDAPDVAELRSRVIRALALDAVPIDPVTIDEGVHQLLGELPRDAGSQLCKSYALLLSDGIDAADEALADVPVRPHQLRMLQDVLDARRDLRLHQAQCDFVFRRHCIALLKRQWPEQADQLDAGREREVEYTSPESAEIAAELFDGEQDSWPNTDVELETEEESESSDEAEFEESESIKVIRNRRSKANDRVPVVLPNLTYVGHRNSDTVKDVNLGFLDDFVFSGSDDGKLFIFDKHSTDIIQILQGDSAVVNVAQPHPALPILAVSGIDSTIKIFSPTSITPRRFSVMADKDEIVQQNTFAMRRSRFSIPDADLMSVIASRLIRMHETDETGGRRPMLLSQGDLRNLLQEHASDESCNIM